MHKLFKSLVIGAFALLPFAANAADITLDPALGENATFSFSVCSSAASCGDATGPTVFTVEFLNSGLLNSTGSTSRSPTTAGAFTEFAYAIYDPLFNLVATGTPQAPPDLSVVAGVYTILVAWTLDDFNIPGNALQSANWSINLTTSQQPNQVPEPATLLLIGAGILALVFVRRRSRA